MKEKEKKEVHMTEQGQHEEDTVTVSSTHIKEMHGRFDQRLKEQNRIKKWLNGQTQ